jgi:4-amino-4-deoxychorismate lyase
MYNEKEIENYTITPYFEKSLTTFRLIRDDNIKYDLKYSNRINIDKLWNLRQDCDDIIIVKNGNITDSRFANLVLFDGQKWLTPDTPLLNGTCRQRLIDEKIITPKRITIEDLFHYSKLTTINAMIGFNPNRFIYISEKTIKR